MDYKDRHVTWRLAGQSWKMETKEVRELFKQYGRLEKEEHAKAWPDFHRRSETEMGSEVIENDDDGGDDDGIKIES